MMRGKIIHYRADEGSGLVSAAGRQYEFNIRQWQGEVAPTVNRVVEVALDEEYVTRVALVPEDVLLRERATELKAKLGGAGNLLGAGGGEIGRNVLARLGLPLAIAYGVFFLASLFFGFGALKGITLGDTTTTLYGTVDLLARDGKSSLTLLLFAAYASFLVPVFWKHRFAPLATLLPLLLVLVLLLQIYGIFSDATAIYQKQVQEAQRLYGGFARDMMKGARSPYPGFSDFFSFGLGFYLCLSASLAVAWLGAGSTLISIVRRGASSQNANA